MGIRSVDHSASSSIDSSSDPNSAAPIQSNSSAARLDLISTDLRLGLSISPCNYYNAFFPTPTPSAHAGKALDQKHPSLFIKIYMEGIPIGRKLNLFAQQGYDGLIRTIARMFLTTILCPSADRVHSDKYVLTYEDKEGDWMMVGDVPWE
ncbi:auxin-responsive protein IAA31 isoform X3 [Fagus crenata]